jgi:Flp pilus assembly protein protease CpaA
MLELLVFATVVHISIYDYRNLRIRNVDSALLALLFAFDLRPSSLLTTISWIAISIVTFHLVRIGMGDLKLWIVLVLTEGQIVLSIAYLHRLVLTAVLVVFGFWLKSGTLRGTIAFAPVLLIPFISLYLAI